MSIVIDRKALLRILLSSIVISSFACIQARSYDRRHRKAKGLFGGAIGGAVVGGLIGGGKGAGYGALAGGVIGLLAGSEADRRARYYDAYRPEIYRHGIIEGHEIYYFINEEGFHNYFYYDAKGRKVFVALND